MSGAVGWESSPIKDFGCVSDFPHLDSFVLRLWLQTNLNKANQRATERNCIGLKKYDYWLLGPKLVTFYDSTMVQQHCDYYFLNKIQYRSYLWNPFSFVSPLQIYIPIWLLFEIFFVLWKVNITQLFIILGAQSCTFNSKAIFIFFKWNKSNTFYLFVNNWPRQYVSRVIVN